jgi:acyl phosphate:glycerol-3-phosphate acyltransferase
VEILFAALAGYLLGSIPFGLLLTQAFGAGDVRQIGSGSIGATNVLRTGRKGLAAATVLLDAGKGVAAVLLAAMLWPGTEGYSAVAAIAGHCFPVWLRFKGGKGFATAAGVLLAMSWPVFLIGAAIWALAVGISRISSVASLAAVMAAPVVAWAMGQEYLVATLLAVAAVVVFQHRANIGRLLRGEEPRIGRSNKADDAA